MNALIYVALPIQFNLGIFFSYQLKLITISNLYYLGT